MDQDSLAKRLGTGLRNGGVFQRGLDRIRYRAGAIGGKQRVGMGAEISGIPPTFAATIGIPAAAASITT